MRRNNFWIGALTALITFVLLTAFVGRRPWGWHRGWRHDRYQYDCRHHRNDRDSSRAFERQHASPYDSTHTSSF